MYMSDNDWIACCIIIFIAIAIFIYTMNDYPIQSAINQTRMLVLP